MNEKYGILVICAAISFLYFVGAASATTWSVDDSGEADFTRILDAIDKASAGDTILVYSGVYYENVVVDKSVTLKGFDHPVVDARRRGSVVTLTADGIILEGFNVTNSEGSRSDGLMGGVERGAGIKIISSNNIITDNTASNNDYGIYLYNSSNNTITGNLASNNYDGIYLSSSSHNNITGNNVSSNNRNGIYLLTSCNNSITDNPFNSNNRNGIRLESSSNNNTITGNTFVNDGLAIDTPYQNTVEDNTVNGKPLVYLKDVSNYKIEDAGQVILVNCSNITVENLDLSNISVGIELWGTVDSTISNNKVCNNRYSIRLKSSGNNTITGNTVCHNNQAGIVLSSSSNNTITGNTVCHNDYDGIDLSSSCNCIITGNNVSNSWKGIDLSSSSNNSITGNNVSNNNYHGISLKSSSNNTITGNNVSNNDDGIHLSSSCNNNTITGNRLVNDGLSVYKSNQNIVEDNTVNGKPLVYLEDASDYKVEDAGQVILINCSNITVENLNISNIRVGIELWGTVDSTISNNKVCNNRYGIILKSSGNNSITGNTVCYNYDGIGLWHSSDNNTITGNNVSNNWDYSLGLYSSCNNTITDNNVGYNSQGIYHSSSCNNIITGNNVCNNSGGISFRSSSNCTITGNNVCHNGPYDGISLRSSSNNTITGNNVCNNNWNGISLSSSSNNNTITGNTFVNDGLSIIDSPYRNTVEDNTVNGKPLVYLKDVSNYKIEDAGQIILVNCSNITAENLDISNISVGIELRGTEDSTISNNKVSDNNRYGIRLKSSGNNTITGNTLCHNEYEGIDLSSSSNNIIKGNNVSNNKGVAIFLDYSSNNTITGNTVCNNGIFGILLSSSSNNNITGNNVSNNNWRGIFLWGSSNSTITGNTVCNNTRGGEPLVGDAAGIFLQFSSNSTITGNNVCNNDEGIYLQGSTNNTIRGNSASNNGEGIYLNTSSSNKIFLNNFVNNINNAHSYKSTNIWNSTEEINHTYNGSTFTNYLGNYWDDYEEKYPDAEEIDTTGIWDTPYSIDDDKDNYPLIERFENYLTFETIRKGHFSGHNERKNYVITNNNDWANLWNKTYSINSPKPSLPEIDFTQNMVIAVFQGVRNTGGYNIEIIKIVENEHTLEVFVKETSPGPNCVVPEALTQPYHIIKIQKQDKEIVFKIDQEVRICE